jgi:hypothetical protein
MQAHFFQSLQSIVKIERPPADLALIEFFCEADSIAISMSQASLRQLWRQIGEILPQAPGREGRPERAS